MAQPHDRRHVAADTSESVPEAVGRGGGTLVAPPSEHRDTGRSDLGGQMLEQRRLPMPLFPGDEDQLPVPLLQGTASVADQLALTWPSDKA